MRTMNATSGTAGLLLPPGTRIRFTETLTEGMEDHPSRLYAYRGHVGEITGHDGRGYSARVSWWPLPFRIARHQFEVMA